MSRKGQIYYKTIPPFILFSPGFMLEDLEEIFQYEVLKMLKKEGKITDAVIENMLSWRHSGFHVYTGDRIFSVSQIPWHLAVCALFFR